LGQENEVTKLDLSILTSACEKMASEKTGAIIVLERSNSLDFLKNTGDKTQIELSSQILETIFFKNSPLHDGAIIIKDNTITATRVVLPVSDSTDISKKYGLRHKAGAGISEKTDALVIVVSEQRGLITYIKDGEFSNFTSVDKLKRTLSEDLSY
jgi:DNA integrity scanning protein DisA with diadenylate cyclase activity